jgi:hypothetical protein
MRRSPASQPLAAQGVARDANKRPVHSRAKFAASTRARIRSLPMKRGTHRAQPHRLAAGRQAPRTISKVRDQ